METSLINQITEFINSVGFPIGVAVFSLVKLNKTIEDNTKVMIRIAEKLDIKEEKIDA